eukprot:271167-Amorphochlora_amoeboformis.AAC.2
MSIEEDSLFDDGNVVDTIDILLETTEPNLEKILNNDEVIQECKYMNERLTSYLSRPEVLKQLIHYTVHIPTDEDSKQADRCPYVASELFACEITTMLDGLYENESTLDTLFGFLDRAKSIDPRTSGYFSKVVRVLIQRTFQRLEAYLKKHPEIILKMAKKIHLYVVMEILVMVGWDTTVSGERDAKWLADALLIPELLRQLESKGKSATHENTCSALQALVRSWSPGLTPSSLLIDLESKSNFTRLASIAGGKNEVSAKIGAIKVIREVLSRAQVEMSESKSKKSSHVVSTVLSKVLPEAVEVLVDSDEKKLGKLQLQYGYLAPPFGPLRLEFMRLINTLLKLPLEEVREAAKKFKLLKISVDLMLEYPFHNLLHNLVRNIVSNVLEGGGGTLRESLFQEALLTQNIIKGFEEHKKRTKVRKANRMGYTGHLVVMANELEKIATNDEDVKKILDDTK